MTTYSLSGIDVWQTTHGGHGMRFPVKEFLTAEIGPAQNVHALFSSHGLAVEMDTVRKWYERDSISGDKLALILLMLEVDRGAPVSVMSHMLFTEGKS